MSSGGLWALTLLLASHEVSDKVDGALFIRGHIGTQGDGHEVVALS